MGWGKMNDRVYADGQEKRAASAAESLAAVTTTW